MNPTLAELLLLSMIRGRESARNYTAPPKSPPRATASGAYQFIRATWAWVSSVTGVGKEVIYAYQATKEEQDTNALWLLRNFGPNSSKSWQASGPYPPVAELEAALDDM